MKKIVFVTLMLADDMLKRHYPVDGNSFIEYPGELYYAINSVLARTMKKDDEIKVVLLETRAGDKAGTKNAQLFMDELNEINTSNSIGAKITYEIIPSDFLVSKKGLNEIYLKLIKNLEPDQMCSVAWLFPSQERCAFSLSLIKFASSVLGYDVILHFRASLPIMTERTSTRANRVFCFTYSFKPFVRNNAAVNTPMVRSSSHKGAFCSTRARTSGAMYNCVKLSSTSNNAVNTQNSITRFLLFQAILIIHPTFWRVLYLGFSFTFIFASPRECTLSYKIVPG